MTDSDSGRLAATSADNKSGRRPAARREFSHGQERAYLERAFGVTEEVKADYYAAYHRLTSTFTLTVLGLLTTGGVANVLHLNSMVWWTLVGSLAIIGGAFVARAYIRLAVAAKPIVTADVRIFLSEMR